LRIRPRSASPAVMGGAQRLGWSGWLGPSPTDAPVVGMRFEPEPYAKRLARKAARSCGTPEKVEVTRKDRHER